MFHRAQWLLDKLVAEFKHHADPQNHKPITIEPVTDVRAKVGMAVMGSFGLLMVPVAAALPILPTWPFALVLIIAMARSSTRFRVWLSNNRAFHTLMSVVRTRPECVFRMANRAMTWMLGDRGTASQTPIG